MAAHLEKGAAVPPAKGLLGVLRGYAYSLRGADLFELSAVMTLLMIALSLHESVWYVRAAIVTLAVSGIVIRPLLQWPLLWLGLAAVFAFSYSTTWFQQNNHDFLKLYWCVAIGVSLLVSDWRGAIQFNARVLIGICFLFAVLWKAVSPDYITHDFFNLFILQDSRFRLISEFLGGVSAAELRAFQQEWVSHTAFGDPEGSLAIPLAAKVAWIAPVMSWWTLFIEGLVAVAFLLPRGKGLSKWRDATLLSFVFTTYFVTPVLYFAWILIAMGVVQCDRTTSRWWPSAYVVAFVLILMRFYVPV